MKSCRVLARRRLRAGTKLRFVPMTDTGPPYIATLTKSCGGSIQRRDTINGASPDTPCPHSERLLLAPHDAREAGHETAASAAAASGSLGSMAAASTGGAAGCAAPAEAASAGAAVPGGAAAAEDWVDGPRRYTSTWSWAPAAHAAAACNDGWQSSDSDARIVAERRALQAATATRHCGLSGSSHLAAAAPSRIR